MGEPALKKAYGFQPGVSGNPAGKPKGVLNRTTRDVRALAQRLVNDRKYLRALLEELRKRTLHPQIESLLWFYAYGKPRETIDVSVTAAQMVQVVLPHNYREALPEEKPAIEVEALPEENQ